MAWSRHFRNNTYPLQQQNQRMNFEFKIVPQVMKDEDGDVIMRDAPGADPDAPLLDQWCPRNR